MLYEARVSILEVNEEVRKIMTRGEPNGHIRIGIRIEMTGDW